MGRRRKSNHHLPKSVYLRSGSYYFVDYTGKWILLSSSYTKAIAKYSQLIDSSEPITTLNDLFDRYLTQVAPLKAESTYKGNIKQSKALRVGLGDMRVDELKPRHVYQYMDVRSKRGEVQTNR
ncbi:MAG TPA: integrase, partial [Gammaproteobacteria bacterium]|nr:integrase [Gammaproteobacteria bacterium]